MQRSHSLSQQSDRARQLQGRTARSGAGRRPVRVRSSAAGRKDRLARVRAKLHHGNAWRARVVEQAAGPVFPLSEPSKRPRSPHRRAVHWWAYNAWLGSVSGVDWLKMYPHLNYALLLVRFLHRFLDSRYLHFASGVSCRNQNASLWELWWNSLVAPESKFAHTWKEPIETNKRIFSYIRWGCCSRQAAGMCVFVTLLFALCVRHLTSLNSAGAIKMSHVVSSWK